MSDGTWSESEEINSLEMKRPHVVILGAGASSAAFPNGDRKGRCLPLMRTLVDAVGLTALLRDAGIAEPYHDFEAVYSEIALDPSQVRLKTEVEDRVNAYFSSLELPDDPTLYDHLVLSLRPKDVIATFNWDPFLFEAAARNHAFGGAPTLLFLHGNVAFSYCVSCKTAYPMRARCCRCGAALTTTPLLYPVKQKDYQTDPVIAEHWRKLDRALQGAWALTIFGYGAPKTDVEAIRTMKAAWGDVYNRELEQTEIIDVRTEDDLTAAWSPFIHTHHYNVQTTFYDSYIARFPRRSGEALWAQLMDVRYLSPHAFPKDADFPELCAWLRPRIEAEKRAGEQKH